MSMKTEEKSDANDDIPDAIKIVEVNECIADDKTDIAVENLAKLSLEQKEQNAPTIITESLINNGESKKNSHNNKNFELKNDVLAKETIYAKPLRKLDRPPRAKSTTKCMQDTKTNASDDMNNTNGATEDRHILNFLKDTTKLQKKLQRNGCGSGNNSSGDSEYGKGNFSSLAQEQHFVNLVQQNVIGYSDNVTNETDSTNTDDETSKLNANLSIDRDTKLVQPNATSNGILLPKISSKPSDVCIKREWIIKLIALCLEQRLSKSCGKLASSSLVPNVCVDEAVGESHKKPNSTRLQHKQSSQYSGVMLLGSNGSGKTSICKRIINGNTGTQGMLSRKLLCCYFINTQNVECHSLSTFIRCIVMQILSHSTFLSSRDDACDSNNASKISNELNISADTTATLDATLLDTTSLIIDKTHTNSIDKIESNPAKMPIIRQKSETTKNTKNGAHDSIYDTYPPSQKVNDLQALNEPSSQCSTPSKNSKRGCSKIPIKIGFKSVCGKEIPNASPSKKATDSEKSTAVSNIMEDGDDKAKEEESTVVEYENIEIHKKIPKKNHQPPEMVEIGEKLEKENECNQPLPPPKTKSYLQMIADEYYTILTQNPEIMESLNADNIEKNPDECFKKAILYPFLELQPPKTALLFLVDSIDEHYINDEETVISTLKGSSTPNRSRTIAELLSNNFHMIPKWLYLVCTAKRQNRHIVKKFNGFKKIALDDLRKSHVVKDVQEYIIARLNADFKGQINFSADIIDCLNQLYIKSNGSILYLEKVLSGIREHVFSFREIKLIPCTLNGLYLYICQKSFNKKQYTKIRPILNILLASSDFVELSFVLNCLRTFSYSIDRTEFDKRINAMRYVLAFNDDQTKVKIFHNSFSDWLSDVKFSTKKFLCSVNEGHAMISMYYTLVSDTLCPNQVLKYFGHLIKCDEHAKKKSINLDLILMLLESNANLVDCFYVNALNCCAICEIEYKQTYCIMPRMRLVIERYLNKVLADDVLEFIGDFFKPSLPTNTKVLKLLIETGINNADCQFSYDSMISSPVTEDNNDELAKLLLNSEKSCQRNNSKDVDVDDDEVNEYQEIVSPQATSPSRHNMRLNEKMPEHQLLSSGKALIHLLANDGNVALLKRGLNACKKDGNGLATIDLEIEDECGQTALNIAARNGHYEIVELLLSLRYICSSTNQIKRVNVDHTDRGTK